MERILIIKVSIITPCYNSEKYIDETIKSICNQAYENLEIIVIDGLSGDNTLNILEKYKTKIFKIISEPDTGMYNAINKGLKIASGDIVCYLNSDDLFNKNTIKFVVQTFENNLKIKWLYGSYSFIDNSSQIIYNIKSHYITRDEYLCYADSKICQPSIFWKKEIHDEIGYFNENYKLAGDYDFIVRLISDFKYTNIPEFLSKMRLHGDTLSVTNNEKLYNEVFKIRSKYKIKNSIYHKFKFRFKQIVTNYNRVFPFIFGLEKRKRIENGG